MTTCSEPFLLSSKGSMRATSYGFSNKSVTLNGKTHVVWLDRPATVCGRTYDHATKKWGPTHTLCEGSDNHTSPALVADSFGDPHLRLVIGPHGAGWNNGQFKWFISENPGSIEAWKWEYNVGYLATYPALIHTPQGVDALAYRGGEWPPSIMFQRQISLRHWTKAREIFKQDIEPQYAHYGAYLDVDARGTLYLACHFYNVGNDLFGPDEKHRSYGIAILKSADLGETWSNRAGEAVSVPTVYQDRIGVPPLGEDMRLGGLALDSRGAIWVLAGDVRARTRDLLLSRWTSGGWKTKEVGQFLPKERMAVDSFLTIDAKDRLHLAVTALLPDALKDKTETAVWGHASCEVFHLVSADNGETFTCRQVSRTDPICANWLPTISRSSPSHPVENPVILYTHGAPGAFCDGNAEEPLTEVYGVFVEEE